MNPVAPVTNAFITTPHAFLINNGDVHSNKMPDHDLTAAPIIGVICQLPSLSVV
jgi:hypothetical protein